MKYAKAVLYIFILVIPIKSAFASPELVVSTGSDVSERQVEVPWAEKTRNMQVLNIDDIYSGQKTIEDVILNRVNIIGDEKISIDENRTCLFCFLFALAFLAYILNYGAYLKKIKRKKDMPKKWFQPVVKTALFIYIIHAIVHINLASPIYLEYYWMILFDEAIIGYYFIKQMIARKRYSRAKKPKVESLPTAEVMKVKESY